MKISRSMTGEPMWRPRFSASHAQHHRRPAILRTPQRTTWYITWAPEAAGWGGASAGMDCIMPGPSMWRDGLDITV